MDIKRNNVTEVFVLDFYDEKCQRQNISCVLDISSLSIVGLNILNIFELTPSNVNL
ncbi:hypothetical protein [Paenibacillus guangzhouensis]|uniref:hypothetical protein n=1 Tax=Paenibacillus guangzhouensis TaxID=1473112 RepID=UPI00187B1D8F|nr:hypothetical protein [Paenibacillus guangzhouensis]